MDFSCVIVVVKPLVFEAHLAGYGTPEFVQIPGIDVGIERNGE